MILNMFDHNRQIIVEYSVGVVSFLYATQVHKGDWYIRPVEERAVVTKAMESSKQYGR
jgi:hypothetical protein